MADETPGRRRIIVDGSNLATEGRTAPSLAQLDEAIRDFLEEHPGFTAADVTVVVDATFGHRIDPSEVPAFEQALEHGEMITPPAGAVGRGDGFILRIAEKSGALVLSNDSFQEFHAERPWLFEPGRLIGGKPVAGVGWVFTPRIPVRGPRSRSVTAQSRREAKAAELEAAGGPADAEVVASPPTTRAKKAAKAATGATTSVGAPPGEAPAKKTAVKKAAATKVPAKKAAQKKAAAETTPKKAAPAAKAAKAEQATKAAKAAKAAKAEQATKATKATKAAKAAKAEQATKAATEAAPAAEASKKAPAAKAAKAAKTAKAPARRARATTTPEPGAGEGPGAGGVPTRAAEALNDPATFVRFVAGHLVGTTFEGRVVSFTSHGAHVDVDGMLCHVPLRGLGDPPPQKARLVLAKGESRTFVLVSLDAKQRRAELALAEPPA